MCPVILGGAGGNAEHRGGFFDEITRLDQLGLRLAVGGKFVEGFIRAGTAWLTARLTGCFGCGC